MSADAGTVAGHRAAMDRMYRFQRHIYDASRRYYLLGRDTLLDRLNPPPGGSILEIGCGTGRNLICAARRYPDARLFGIDISEEMLRSALRASSRAGLAKRIAFACADAAAFDPVASLRQAAFDRIVFSYSLSMIPDWQGALRRAAEFLAPTGELHVADFGQCEAMPRALRAGLHRWLGWFSVTPRAMLGAEIAAIARRRGDLLRVEPVFGGYANLLAMVPPRAEGVVPQ